MTNYSERRQQQAEARQAQMDQNNRDFSRGLNGINVTSVWGQIGLQQSRNNSGGGNSRTSGAMDLADSPTTAAPSKPARPFLPGIDKWLATIPPRVFVMLALAGAIGGFGYGFSTGGTLEGAEDALLGGLGGFIFIHLLARLFKVAVGAVLVGIVCCAIYYACFAPGH